MTPRNIGRQISKKRRQMGFTQQSLASQIGLTVPQLKFIEHGRKNIDPDSLKKIESILGPIEDDWVA